MTQLECGNAVAHDSHSWWGGGLNAEPWECPGVTEVEFLERVVQSKERYLAGVEATTQRIRGELHEAQALLRQLKAKEACKRT